MECEFCNKDFEDIRDCLIKKATAQRFCSVSCRNKGKAKDRKAKMAKLIDRVCQLPGCENQVTSHMKHTKTCSRSCGNQLKQMTKKKYFKLASDINSSSNSLIRLKNKFLQMAIS